MMSKVRLYLSTASHLKPRQIIARISRGFGRKIPLKKGYKPNPQIGRASIKRVAIFPQLDFDSAFINRFNINDILEDRIELLHHAEQITWSDSWHEALSTPLWQFNLHYCEYLLPLARAYITEGNEQCLVKGKQIIESWINNCSHDKGGVAWNPYTISLRAINWLAFYGELSECLDDDTIFLSNFNVSLANQYISLAGNLEKDLLANHYLENLKTLVILACYFDDRDTLDIVLPEFLDQVKKQILPDGMHFELSPMYHKVVLEDLMRVGQTLSLYGIQEDYAKILHIQDMCDCLYSLERNIDRTPLFNDSGDNVAKSMKGLLDCAQTHFGIIPVFKNVLPDAGYAILERSTCKGNIKLIFDAGMPGPLYAMGHAHCDTLSFECFVNGKPWIVNRGTYCYQGDQRLDYKRTLSHSTVMVNDMEQHECWGSFRIARFSRGELVECAPSHAKGSLSRSDTHDAVTRTITLQDDKLIIRDESNSTANLTSAFIFPNETNNEDDGHDIVLYSPEFGLAFPAKRIFAKDGGSGIIETEFVYPSTNNS